MKFVVAAIGKQIKPWMQDGVNAYLERFPKGYSIAIDTVPACKSKHNNQAEFVKQKEAAALQSGIVKNQYLIALDERGKQMSSPDWANRLREIALDYTSIKFFIGGAHGLDQSLLQQCDSSWSLGKITLPHGLARVVLIEQLYRSVCLMNNHPYHKV